MEKTLAPPYSLIYLVPLGQLVKTKPLSTCEIDNKSLGLHIDRIATEETLQISN